MDWLLFLLAPLAGYLIGSIPFGYIVARARGVDIFKQGSGNIGATNVGRVLGRPFGVLVFVLDVAKGVVPVLGARWAATAWLSIDAGWLEVLTGLAAFLGHLFPIYLGLRGGKGVATGTGVVLVLVPGPALAALIVWSVVVLATRYVSVASILAVLALVTAQVVATVTWSDPRTLFCLLAGALVIVKHRSNLARLAAGSENQLKETPAMIRITRSLHVVAVALWFGSAVFFSLIAAPLLFSGFEKLGEQEMQRAWFQRAPWFNFKDDALNVNGPKEQGTRAAGYAIGPMFLWYFALQGVCGFVALATALPWAQRGGVHRWRLSLLLTAVVLVVAGWPVERYVEAVRDPRNQAYERYLQAQTAENLAAMQAARSEFGMWHGVSLLLNFAVIICVAGATALSAHLPADTVAAPATNKDAAPLVPESVQSS
jgi:acyl-phosphate glycerol 3-phosphate acyltransferase